VSLDQLSEPVAVIVGGMKPGDVTPVIETEDGLTILRCTQLIEPTSPTLDEFAPTIAARLKGERFTAAWDRLTRDLLDRLMPSIRPAAVTAAAAPDTVVATVRGEQGPHPILLDDYQVFLASRKVRRAPWELSEEDHRQRIEERVLVEARAGEAVVGGSEGRGNDRTRLADCGAGVGSCSMRRSPVPSSLKRGDVRSLYEARKDGLKEVEKLHLKVLRIAITPEHGPDFYRRLAELGDRLATGATGFSDAVARLGADAELEDLGWVTRDRMWMMGKNVNHAVSALEPGATSPVVQEGSSCTSCTGAPGRAAHDEARRCCTTSVCKAPTSGGARTVADHRATGHPAPQHAVVRCPGERALMAGRMWARFQLATVAVGAGPVVLRPVATLEFLIVTLDTTRADHLGCYGKSSAVTPNVDRMAEEGFLFLRCYTPVPLTTPSHSTIFTGMYPPAHGVRDNGLFVLPGHATTLAELMKGAGWATGAAVGSFPVTREFGLAQGFDYFNDHITVAEEDFRGKRQVPSAAS
jgi:hypothetical protein